jgi:hypothetical protein
MTGAQLAMFATLVGAVVCAWLALFYLFPLAARARFQYRATVLRDECSDAVLDGRLRHVAPVQSFLDRADRMAARPDFFSLTNALTLHRTMRKLNWKPEPSKQICDFPLKPEEQELLDRLNRELERAFVHRLVFGSSFGWLFWLASVLLPPVLSLKRSSKAQSMATPKHLAREYSAVSETAPIKSELLSLSR